MDEIVRHDVRRPLPANELFQVGIQPGNDQDRILVQGRYTAEGLLELTVIDEVLGKPVSDSFIHTPGLSSGEIDKKRRDMAGRA